MKIIRVGDIGMPRRKKTTEENNHQLGLFDSNEKRSNININEEQMLENINKGELLEYQIKRLFFFMGYYPKTNIIIQTRSDEPYDIVTDLDVYGIYIHSDFSMKTIWSDCKSGAAQEINRVAWLTGIKEMIEVDDILFVKKGTKLSTKIFASERNVQIVDLSTIKDMEKRYGIEENDWRGSWNPRIQKENINVFKNISTPNNSICKRIFKFINTHYWAIDDNFTKCKKTITALRDLATLVELPLEIKETSAIKWAVYQLSSMLMLPMLQICRQVQYFANEDKNEIIILGLIYGSNSKSKIDDILKVTNGIARRTLFQYCGGENELMDLPEIKLNQPEYTEAFINMIFRIVEQPLSYFDILRFLDFALLQYDLDNRQYNMEEIKRIFNNGEELLKSTKTFLHFICHITHMPKEVFVLLNDNESN